MADASTSDTTLFDINGRVPRTDVLGDVAARTGAALPRREGAARRHRRVGQRSALGRAHLRRDDS